MTDGHFQSGLRKERKVLRSIHEWIRKKGASRLWTDESHSWPEVGERKRERGIREVWDISSVLWKLFFKMGTKRMRRCKWNERDGSLALERNKERRSNNLEIGADELRRRTKLSSVQFSSRPECCGDRLVIWAAIKRPALFRFGERNDQLESKVSMRKDVDHVNRWAILFRSDHIEQTNRFFVFESRSSVWWGVRRWNVRTHVFFIADFFTWPAFKFGNIQIWKRSSNLINAN